jgi:hypothetical protein
MGVRAEKATLSLVDVVGPPGIGKDREACLKS